MGRALRNTLTEAELLETLTRDFDGDHSAALARYGADLLGRAIGHEHRADPVDLGDWRPVLLDIYGSGAFTASQSVMVGMAIREVMAL